MMLWNSAKSYSDEEIRRMQQEAVQRVQEFQAHSQDLHPFYDFSGTGSTPVIEAPSRVVPEPVPQEAAPIIPAPEPAAAPRLADPMEPFRGLLDQFGIDSEVLMILGLLFLLYNEKADNSLLVALAYLLL